MGWPESRSRGTRDGSTGCTDQWGDCACGNEGICVIMMNITGSQDSRVSSDIELLKMASGDADKVKQDGLLLLEYFGFL
jgi:hypothetical protein